jgi:hypothetical protein
MKLATIVLSAALLPFLPFVGSAQTPSTPPARKFQGQEPIKGVPTESRPVEKQTKAVFPFESEKVFFSNQFTAARLNAVSKKDDGVYDIHIKPENTPVNASPWYAFKVWSENDKPVRFSFSYAGNVRHRYEPKVSNDGKHWQQLEAQTINGIKLYEVKPGSDTLWIAAQELTTSSDVASWVSHLQKNNQIKSFSIGKSTLGKPIQAFSFGNPKSNNYLLVLGRQHPPEVTGHKALTAFVESLLSEGKDVSSFRKDFQIIVLPLLNPDGVDEGFWRHNAGGVDLNRDWSAFNQPETRAVRDYLKKEITEGKKLLAAIDFHSTHDDIYYTVTPEKKGNVPGLITNWLTQLTEKIPGYSPHIKPLYFEPPTYTSFSYLFETYGAESVVFEIGDSTDEAFIQKKGKASAEVLTQLLNAFIAK